MSHFYRIKEICINLGITSTTLYNNSKSGKLPPLEHPNPINTRVSGYSEGTYKGVVKTLLQSVK
jgi:predicted DNA-binding transcriptional regulator AlpA